MALSARVKNNGKQFSGKFEVAIEATNRELAERISDIMCTEYHWAKNSAHYIESFDYNDKGTEGWHIPFYVFDLEYVDEFKRDFKKAKAQAMAEFK